MSTPFHQYASHPLATRPTAAHLRLRDAPEQLVASATAAALAKLTPLARTWGLSPRQLPTVTARPTGDDEIGSIELTWSGDEHRTAWPSLTGRLVIDQRPGCGHRLTLLTRRSPATAVSTTGLGRLHRRRLLQVAVQGFLHELAHDVAPRPQGPDGPSASSFDQTPMFIHHLLPLDADPGHVLAHLADAPQALAEHATTAAIAQTDHALAAGRFRAPARPLVHTRRPGPDELGALRISWHSDEEATGWPTLTLTVLVEPHDRGARLGIVSPREPRYDLSVNRVDKHERDEVLRVVGGAVADALTAALPTTTAAASLDASHRTDAHVLGR